ncbi:MAG: DUF998 domain-containing protein [Azovibrio sp.]|nr:DUF998 domain-containing protein [Azovibrio sp.]
MSPMGALGWLTWGCLLPFPLIVIRLQEVQAGYLPSQQYMSELALGPGGQWMLPAFVSLGLACIGNALHLYLRRIPWFLAALPGLAGICFCGAGWHTLATAADWHIAWIAAAFVLAALGMYLLPRLCPTLGDTLSRLCCWGPALLMLGSTALSDILLPAGTAQRLAALALLSWLALLAWRLDRPGAPSPPAASPVG